MMSIIANMSDSIFSKIIRREVPGIFVYEDDICVVIMDKFPTVEGQTLVVPKIEIDYAFELDEETYSHLFKVAKRVALASDKALGADRTCLVVEGFEVPHTHIKLYPMLKGNKNLPAALKGGQMAHDEKLTELAKKIKSELSSL